MTFINIKLLLIIAVLFTACGTSRDQQSVSASDEDHDHAGEHQLTLFSDNAEFFVEFPPIIIGQEVNFAVHLTSLDTYKPFSKGNVKITLDSGEGQTFGEAEVSGTNGIFMVTMTAEYPGNANIRFEYSENGFSESAEATGIPVFSTHEEVHITEAEAEINDVTFTKENAWKSEFMVYELKPVPFTAIIKTGGEIMAMPGERHLLHAPSSGLVKFNRKNLVAGAKVSADEWLISVEGKGMANENIDVDFAAAESRLYKSKTEYERRRMLLLAHAISEKEFIDSRSVYLIDSIYYYNLKKSYSDGGMKILSPIDGYLHEFPVSEGEYISAGHQVAAITSNKRLLLRADVPQQYFNQIHKIVSTNFRTSYNPEVQEIQSINGKLLAIGNSVAENNHYLPVYFEALNNGDLLEGAYVEFFLKTNTIENSIAIPKSAVLEDQGRYFVYIQISGETYRKREIYIADWDGLNYRVERGLSTGDRIVSKGGVLLKTASVSTALPVHSH